MMAKLLLYFYVVFIISLVNTKPSSYHIPEPEIIAFKNGGLRVILDDEPGISLFGFHANVNEDMKQLDPGSITVETFTKTNRKWIVEDRSIKLHVGDIIYYWMFVEKDKLAYVKQPLQFKIKYLVSYYNEDKITDSITTTKPSVSTSGTDVTQIPTTTTQIPPTGCSAITCGGSYVALQEQINYLNKRVDLLTSITALQDRVDFLAKKFDGVSSASSLQDEMKKVSNTVELILMVLERLPETKRLTLSGAVPPNQLSSPDQIVRVIIKEKLGLKVDVVTAVRNKDDTVDFELSTLQEKFDVLNAVKDKLQDSKIVIA